MNKFQKSHFIQTALKGSLFSTAVTGFRKMLKRTVGFERFSAWSEGYAALTYSLKDKDVIINYIINQREHHKKQTFRDEYVAFLKEMGLVLDVRDWNR